MAITKEQIKDLVETHLKDSALFLIDVLVKTGNVITIILDDNEVVTIENCVEVSRFVERSLDRDKEDFELRVMSAGADSPFQNVRQYQKNLGKKVRVTTLENVKYEGVLSEFDVEKVTLKIAPTAKKGQIPGKNRVVEQVDIPFSDIKETRLVITLQ